MICGKVHLERPVSVAWDLFVLVCSHISVTVLILRIFFFLISIKRSICPWGSVTLTLIADNLIISSNNPTFKQLSVRPSVIRKAWVVTPIPTVQPFATGIKMLIFWDIPPVRASIKVYGRLIFETSWWDHICPCF